MKKTKILIISFLLFIICFHNAAFSQKNASEIINENYKFSFTLPENAFNMRTEESSNKNAITYEFESTVMDDTVGILLLAFKWNDIKILSDFIYHMEKEVTLDIPQRVSDYTEFDSIYFDSKMAIYKNDNLTHIVYYFRTKDDTSENNFTYLLRFKIFTKDYNKEILEYVNTIAHNFYPRKVIDLESSD